MVLVKDADPVLIGNKVESVVPYHTTDEFSVAATEDGQVIDNKEGYLVVKYKSGQTKCIDLTDRMEKNAAAGFFINNKLETDFKVGEKFKKGEVLAFNPRAFTRNAYDRGASMNLGVLTKVAVVPNWDIYEDSTPITESLANRLATTMVADQAVVLDEFTQTDFIAKVGDKVRTGDVLIRFNRAANEDVQELLNNIRAEDTRSELIEDTISTIKSKYTGVVANIEVIPTIETDEFDPSVQAIINDYNKKLSKRLAVLDQYKNENDSNFYKAGQIIKRVPEPIKPNKNGKIKGHPINRGVLIIFYIRYEDIASKGDKVCAEFALKGICSHVIPKGREPWSGYRPDEEISTLIAPLSITARKTPSIFLAMFSNKLIIELKRQLNNIYHDKDRFEGTSKMTKPS